MMPMRQMTRRRLLAGLACAAAVPVIPEGRIVRRARDFTLAWWPTRLCDRFYIDLQERGGPAGGLLKMIAAAEDLFERAPRRAARYYDGTVLPAHPREPFLIAVSGRAWLFAADELSTPIMADRTEPVFDVRACLEEFRRRGSTDRAAYVSMIRRAREAFERVVTMCGDREARSQARLLCEALTHYGQVA